MLRHPRFVFLAAGLVVVLVLAVSLLTNDGADGPETAVVPSATPASTETTTPVPSPSAEELARNFTLTEVSGEAAFITGGAPIPDALGVYYQDVATGAIEGWSLLLPGTHIEAFSLDNRFNVIHRREQLFHNGVIYYAGAYLADRASGKVYSFSGATPVYSTAAFSGSNITSRGDLVLFVIRDDQDGAEWYVVVDIVPTPTVVSRFRLEGMWDNHIDTTYALFSADGSRLALTGRRAYMVNLTTGSTITTDAPLDYPVYQGYAMPLMNVVDGESILAFTNNDLTGGAVWYRVGWDGHVMASGSGTAVYPSPDGTHVAVFQGNLPEQWMNWNTIEAVRTEDGAPDFRAMGVSTWIDGYVGVNRWLSDNSGFVMSNSALQMAIAMRDGTFRPYIGLPAPDSPNRFTSGGGLRDSNGNVLASSPFPIGGAADFVPPFGESSKEIRYRTPHGGHDCCQGAFSLIEPYIETPPYTPGLRLQLSQQAAGEQLLDQALTGQPVGIISGAQRVTVHETVILCTDASSNPIPNCPPKYYEVHLDFAMRHLGVAAGALIGLSGHWARVTTEDGQEGWLLVSVRPLGV